MKKSMLLSLLLWAAIGAGMYSFFGARFEPPGDWIGALIGSLLSMLGIGALRNISFSARDRRLIRAASKGVIKKDGARAGAVGTIKILQDPLVAPFSRRSCAVLSYDISKTKTVRSSKSTHTSTVTFCSGMWMAPCAVRTGLGDIRIFGFPELKQFAKERFETPEAYEAASQFVAQTAFEDLTGFQVRKMLSEISSAINDDDGILMKNWRIEEHIEVDGSDLYEECVLADEPVCAVGRFSQMKNALVQSFGTGDLVRLYRGSPEEVLKGIGTGMFGYFILALFFIGLGTVGAYGILTARENGSGVQLKRRNALETALETDDLTGLRRLMGKHFDINKPDVFGRTLLMKAKSPDTLGVLLKAGAALDVQDDDGRTALMRAAKDNQPALVTALLRAGAKTDLKDKIGFNALMLAHWARAEETKTLLLSAGIPPLKVTGSNGKPVSDFSKGPFAAAKKYYESVYTGDTKALSEVLPDRSPESLEGSDFQYWQASRPRVPELISGFYNAEQATIHIGGRTGSGERGEWEIQLFHDGNNWKLLSERPVERDEEPALNW